jgi:hypothetical protein
MKGKDTVNKRVWEILRMNKGRRAKMSPEKFLARMVAENPAGWVEGIGQIALEPKLRAKFFIALGRYFATKDKGKELPPLWADKMDFAIARIHAQDPSTKPRDGIKELVELGFPKITTAHFDMRRLRLGLRREKT